MDLIASMKIAASGMKAQSTRMRVASENLSNSESTAQTPGGEPYRRRTVSFENRLDRALGVRLVDIDRYGVDRSELEREYEPGHPAADEQGYVLYPNVNPLIELMDLREAQRSFEANLSAMQQARSMVERMLQLLRR